MAHASDSFEAAVLSAWFRGIAFPAPATGIQIALSRTDPLDDGTGLDEPPGGSGYARQTVMPGAGTFSAPAPEAGGGQRTSNLVVVTFGPATASWDTIRWVAYFDAAGPTFRFRSPMATPRLVPASDVLEFQVGELGMSCR